MHLHLGKIREGVLLLSFLGKVVFLLGKGLLGKGPSTSRGLEKACVQGQVPGTSRTSRLLVLVENARLYFLGL